MSATVPSLPSSHRYLVVMANDSIQRVSAPGSRLQTPHVQIVIVTLVNCEHNSCILTPTQLHFISVAVTRPKHNFKQDL